MRILCATALAAAIAAGSLRADQPALLDSAVDAGVEQGHIMREWRWMIGTAITTFTARGPAEEVNALDPLNDPLACQGCLLASSVEYGPEDDTR